MILQTILTLFNADPRKDHPRIMHMADSPVTARTIFLVIRFMKITFEYEVLVHKVHFVGGIFFSNLERFDCGDRTVHNWKCISKP